LSGPDPAGRFVSIVIPVYNALNYTAHCLESIDRHTPEPHEVIIVDNGSTDGTAEWIERRDRDGLISNTSNLGFARAVNQGMAAAVGDPVVVLNNDTLVTTGWLTGLVGALDRDPRIGIAVPMSNYVSGGQLVDPVGYEFAPHEDMEAFAADRAEGYRGSGFGVERVSGLCMAISRSLIERIGGFDPMFAIGNYEDDDYSVRARKAGFRLWVCQDSFIHHFGSRTFSLLSDEHRDLMAENALRFCAKWGIPEWVNPKFADPERDFDPAQDVVPLAG
jgi:GT2 family glycosyltransferase